MEGENNNIITVLIKAANQQIDDHTVECDRDWTVKRLKHHLTETYPTTPSPKQQRLIFSGKLLQDDLTLREVLKNFADVTTHTVHLVCAASPVPTPAKPEPNKTPPPNSVSQPASQPSQQPTQPPTAQPNATPNAYQQSAEAWQQYMNQYQQYWGRADPYQYNTQQAYLRPGHVTTPQYGTSQQQYMAMRRMYATQYMMQYMQYYGGYPQGTPYQQYPYTTPPPANLAPLIPDHPLPVAPDGVANVAMPAAGPAANQNLVMNAQGGQMEEEDEMARDWLDWVYVLCRFSVLLCIIYFYSTFSRFFAVMLLFLVFYIYQNGYLQLPRAGQRRQAAAVPHEPAPNNVQQPAPPQENEIQPNPPVPSNIEPSNDATDSTQSNPQSGTDNTDNTDNNSQNNDENPQSTSTQGAPDIAQNAPLPPSILYMVWCFVTSFFTSLLPQRPPEVDAN